MANTKKKSAPRAQRSRGSIQARGNGRWLARIYRGTDEATGKRLYSSRTIHGSKKDAERELTKMLREADTDSFAARSGYTVKAYLSHWLESVERLKVSARTYTDHSNRFRLYVYPALGALRLDKLTHQHIQRLYADMQTKKQLAPNTIRLTHAPLRQALEHAVRTQEIVRNPADLASPPRAERTERRTLSRQEVDRFLEATATDKYRALWVLLLTTGLRPGEALALKWGDIVDGKLHVQRALTRTGPGKYELAAPKTAKSRRKLSLAPSTLVALAEHRAAQNRAILKQGAKYHRQEHIFADSKGNPLRPDRVSNRWRALLQKHGLPKMRLYDLRHTHATRLFEEGENPKIVQERLGHSSITLTLDTYTHVLPETEARMAEVVERIFGGCKAAV